jgi:eukaryotic-like serine/threonine-protein kinase
VIWTTLPRLALRPLVACLLLFLPAAVLDGPSLDPPARQVIGRSTEGWPIEAYRLGHGEVHIALIGGIHGGYEWNTTLLAYHVIDYFTAYPHRLPSPISLTVVPTANPDGLAAVLGRVGRFSADDVGVVPRDSRFNGNGVDLNRNWDCDWAAAGRWGTRTVSSGHAPFSEVETLTLRDLLTAQPMDAVIFWHSAMPGVYPGGCDGPPTPASRALGATYAAAAGYPLLNSFEAYPITGDASNWLASQGIPAIVVELTDHTGTDWPQNLAGVRAVLAALARTGHATGALWSK